VNDKSTARQHSDKNADDIDFGVLPDLLGYHLRRAQIVMFNDFVKAMADVQITPGQFGVIAIINSNPGLTQSALARAVGIERSTMVAVIDALENRGLVERRPSPNDRRSYALVLSDKGAKLHQDLEPLIDQHEQRLSDDFSEEEKNQLIDLLSRIANGSR
jgi:DNA-binding MarR family transcriptional regulator